MIPLRSIEGSCLLNFPVQSLHKLFFRERQKSSSFDVHFLSLEDVDEFHLLAEAIDQLCTLFLEHFDAGFQGLTFAFLS